MSATVKKYPSRSNVMRIPILIVPSESGSGYRGTLGAPFHGEAEASSPQDVQSKLTAIVRNQLRTGAQIGWIAIPEPDVAHAGAGWLPDDDLTREWLQHIADYRAQVDEEDRRRIEQED